MFGTRVRYACLPMNGTSGLGFRGWASGLLRQPQDHRPRSHPLRVQRQRVGSGVIPASNLTPPGDEEAGITWANNDTTGLNFKVCSGEGCAHIDQGHDLGGNCRQDDRARGRGHLYRRWHRLGVFRWQSHRRTVHRLGSQRQPRTWYHLHRLNGAAGHPIGRLVTARDPTKRSPANC